MNNPFGYINITIFTNVSVNCFHGRNYRSVKLDKKIKKILQLQFEIILQTG